MEDSKTPIHSLFVEKLCSVEIRPDGLITVAMPDGIPLDRVRGEPIKVEQVSKDLTKVTLTIFCNTVKKPVPASDNTDQEKRLSIVNQLIVEIANRGRKFFNNNGIIACLGIADTAERVFYIREWINNIHEPACIWVYGDSEYLFKRWYHGDTLKCLIASFAEYVITGDTKSYLNRGLNNPHWGYPAEDMEAIQNKAIELGYLNNINS